MFNTVAFPLSGPLSNGLRAAGDIKFTMVVSIASTMGGRLAFSILFAVVLDWVVRAVIFTLRLRSGKWKTFQVI